ncbi:alpha-ketoacid dehydrogenase subunit beta [Ligilactobacillus sp. Marseille-Q7487]|jgi:pyruvate dehydrogenase E1 component beta subunit|uniref:alpha-ketoacid dehydrogenase subunit beta n=1 Tax=Ligilactobacillus sp. Marseille-Q7487 TaxID=3022128 RepID=UPI0015B62C94|nr:alpha-ketoacid dehydrogenase subunit beta [Ligilactobacillus sp. Marseille-Q7487]
MAKITMIKAITEAMDQELKNNDKVLIFGEDVGRNGGVFRATDGLQDIHGKDRVFDTPLAESGIGGLAFGLALQGFRPICEIQFFGFVFEVMDQIAGQISRTHYRMSKSRKMPVTIRAPFGGGVHTPELHSDSLEGLMAQTPGIRVVIPSGPYDAKGLLLSAIRSDDPVVFLEHMKLYRSVKEEVPEEMYTIPLDKADVKREGKDLTIISYGYMVQESLKAADALAKEGIDVEVVDLRTVSPIDEETILASVQKTGRVVLVQEAQQQAGVSSQVATIIAEKGIMSLEAPIGRVYAPDTPYPFGEAEHAWLPNKNDIIAKVKEIVNY